MSAPVMPAKIVDGMTEADYFAHPALSHSGIKLLLEAPAKFQHAATTGDRETKASFDFGTVAHALVLGVGDVTVIDADDWRGKAAREQRDEAREEGSTPILAKDWAVCWAMAEALRTHPVAAALLADGKPEQSLFWTLDGIDRRARIDWLPNHEAGGRLIVADYKTTTNASVRAFERAIVDYGYHTAAQWYAEGVEACTGADDVRFLFIAQEKTAPFLVNVFELSAELLAIAEQRIEHALDVWRACTETGVWPGYSDQVERAIAPTWASIQHEHDLAQWGKHD